MGARSQTILFLLFHSFGGFGPKIKGGGGGGAGLSPVSATAFR